MCNFQGLDVGADGWSPNDLTSAGRGRDDDDASTKLFRAVSCAAIIVCCCCRMSFNIAVSTSVGEGECEFEWFSTGGQRATSARRCAISFSSCWRVSWAAASRVFIVRCANYVPIPPSRPSTRSLRGEEKLESCTEEREDKSEATARVRGRLTRRRPLDGAAAIMIKVAGDTSTPLGSKWFLWGRNP